MRFKAGILLTSILSVFIATLCFAASHREAPLISLDPAADNTDVYFFVGYDEDNLARDISDQRVVMIMNVNPGQEPGDGPNYFNFDDDVAYRFIIDNNADGLPEDIIYEIRFSTETRPALGAITGPFPYIGSPAIGTPLDGITALDGPGSEGLTRRQTYTVTEIRGNSETQLFEGQLLVAVPSNVGPATFTDYEDLASQGIYTDGDIRVFVGQRAETFYIDLGAVFDTANLRRFPPLLTPAEDGNDAANPFGINRFSGFNISTIALEIPISRITSDGESSEDTENPVIGMYASTNRQANTKLRKVKPLKNLEFPTRNRVKTSGPLRQVSRMANPLVDELIIDTPFKDHWNVSEPEDEGQFEELFKDPTFATELFLVFGFPVTPAPRTDLIELLLKYPGQLPDGDCVSICSELLRLDVTVPPRAAELQKRLGGVNQDAAGLPDPDPAGVPNGRRPNDDVTDILIRIVGGPVYDGARAGDGVNFLQDAPGIGTADGPGYGSIVGNDLDVTTNGIAKEFPFLPTPHDGRNRQHIDCDEPGGNACN